jgi:hypothetical protein
MSNAPAAAKGTMMRTGRVGYVCAIAARYRRGHGSARGQMQELAAAKFNGVLLPCTCANGRERAMRAWIDRTNDGLSGMPADGIRMPPKKGLRHVPLGRLEG